MDEWLNYESFDRKTWHSFCPNAQTFLTQENLDDIKSLNDRISLDDVHEVYMPLVRLIRMQYLNYQQLQLQKMAFLHQPARRVPYIIGIAGSVAVGKSTSARLLQILIKRMLPDKRVELITTDGFIYPNQELERRGIMARKGFPESYDMEKLLTFLNDVNAGKDRVEAPIYSHSCYDIIPGKVQVIEKPDILIVEGINVLQLPRTQTLYVSDFFDFSLYIDANPDLIEKWYLERFGMLLDTAFQDPGNYYYPYTKENREVVFDKARQVWDQVDLPNLRDYILPTRNRADVILHKTKHHYIDRIYLRQD